MRYAARAVALASVVAFPASAQQLIDTIAGGGPNGVPALAANVDSPFAMAVDSILGTFVVARNRVFRVDPAGTLTVVAGDGTDRFTRDGELATEVGLGFPTGIAVDRTGNVFVTEMSYARVRRIDGITGIITTAAGTGLPGFSGDGGLATEAQLEDPTSLTIDPDGNLLIADRGNNRIRMVDAITGSIRTVAGNGGYGFDGDGRLATSTSLASPQGLAFDGAGNLFIADTNHQRIRRVDATTDVVTTVAGDGTLGFSGDGGPATSAALSSPTGIAVDAAGNLFIVDSRNQRLRRVESATGIITTMAGDGTAGFSGDDGPPQGARFSDPFGVSIDPAGNLFLADRGNHRIRRIDPARTAIATFAGNGTPGFSGDGGPAMAASLSSPLDVAVDRADNLLIADSGNARIRRLDRATGRITTAAGDGVPGFAGDGGPATGARLSNPGGVAVDLAGHLFVADAGNRRVRRVDAVTAVITTVAGNGLGGFSGDGGPATSASLSAGGLAVDAAGNLFIADTSNGRVRRVDGATGIITTVAGSGAAGFSGDGGPATSAGLGFPTAVAVDAAGNLFIADAGHQRVRRVDGATLVIDTVAGNGGSGFGGDQGPATSASLWNPRGLAVDGAGNLLIADQSNQRIRRVEAATGLISTVAGSGAFGVGGDGGPATSASLAYPGGLSIDGAGNLLIAEVAGQRIRSVGGF